MLNWVVRLQPIFMNSTEQSMHPVGASNEFQLSTAEGRAYDLSAMIVVIVFLFNCCPL